MSENQNRVPEGVPTGGQFAATEKPDAAVALGGPAQARADAEDALRGYETYLRSGYGDDPHAASRLREAAHDLVPHLPGSREAAVATAISAYDHSPTVGTRNKLHAELVDALADAPTQDEVAELSDEVAGHDDALNDAIVARDIGHGDQAAVDVALESMATPRSALYWARTARHDATLMRVAQGRPTVHDMQDLQRRAHQLRLRRRAAVLEADDARDFYQRYPDDDDQAALHQVQLSTDYAIRREAEVQEAFATAQRHLDEAQAAWDQLQGVDR